MPARRSLPGYCPQHRRENPQAVCCNRYKSIKSESDRRAVGNRGCLRQEVFPRKIKGSGRLAVKWLRYKCAQQQGNIQRAPCLQAKGGQPHCCVMKEAIERGMQCSPAAQSIVNPVDSSHNPAKAGHDHRTVCHNHAIQDRFGSRRYQRHAVLPCRR